MDVPNCNVGVRTPSYDGPPLQIGWAAMTHRFPSLLLAVVSMASSFPANALRTAYTNYGDIRCQQDRSHVADPQSPWQCDVPGSEGVTPSFGPTLLRATFRHESPIPELVPSISSEDLLEVTLSAMPWLGIAEIDITPGQNGDTGGLLLRDVLYCDRVCEETAVPNIRGVLFDAKTGITVDIRDHYRGNEVIYRLPNGDVLWFKGFHWSRSATTSDSGYMPQPELNSVSQDGCINANEASDPVVTSGTGRPGALVRIIWNARLGPGLQRSVRRSRCQRALVYFSECAASVPGRRSRIACVPRRWECGCVGPCSLRRAQGYERTRSARCARLAPGFRHGAFHARQHHSSL